VRAAPPAAAESSGERAPLSDTEFAALMAALGPFEPRPAIAAGVSGGPDSMALALLLRDWVASRDGRLLALVVDHGLRPGSADEAALVVERLAALGIAALVLRVTGDWPSGSIQATARARRYALLEAAAERAGMLHLVVAHHAADQRETVAMRAAAGSGPRGLAGMAPIRELCAVRLLRPLLPVEPARLRALLRARSVDWLEDPSNRDPRFWRARARAAGELPALVNDTTERAALEHRLARFLAGHAQVHPAGFVELSLDALSALAADERRQLLGRLVAAVGGRAFAPRGRSLARLDAWLCDPSSPRCSLGGTLVERRRTRLRVLREARGLPAELALAGGRTIWDGRFRIDWLGAEATAGGPPSLRAAGQGGGGARALRAWLAAVGAPEPAAALPALVLATLPLVSRDAQVLALGPWVAGAARGVLAVVFRPTHTMTAVGSAPSVCCADEQLTYLG